jgi:hypothetical protein
MVSLAAGTLFELARPPAARAPRAVNAAKKCDELTPLMSCSPGSPGHTKCYSSCHGSGSLKIG